MSLSTLLDRILGAETAGRRLDAEVTMRERTVQCMGPHGLHRMAYREWGDPANPRVLICAHGLTRNGRDFDTLATVLCRDYRVVCPDVAGRGRSEWLAVKDDYALPLYVSDMITLIARLDVESIHWVGTSMGGLIGMLIASQPGNPIHRLVLNDVGPVVTAASVQRTLPEASKVISWIWASCAKAQRTATRRSGTLPSLVISR